jgi:nitrogen fixation NifU-like protein
VSDLYNGQVMDHFMHPRNVGEIKDADGVGETGNPTCGDIMKIFLRIEKNDKDQEYIKDIKFQTFGCGAAVATSSMITEMVKGKILDQAEKISNQAVAEALGGLPPVKMHCSNLAANALHEAIKDYQSKKKLKIL